MPLQMGIRDIAKRYSDMLENGTLLSNRVAIDAIDGRILELMERLDTEGSPDRVKNLYLLWQEYKQAEAKDDGAGMIVAKKSLDIEFEKIYHDYAAWSQMIEIFDLRRKMVDSEIKAVKDMKAILTAEQAYKLVAKLMAVCIQEVKDSKTLRRINAGFSRIVGEDKLPARDEVIDLELDEEEAV